MLGPLAVDLAEFDEVIAVLAALLIAGALISGFAHRSFISLTALFVIAEGIRAGRGRPRDPRVRPRVRVRQLARGRALILILFRDGLEVEEEMLQREWHLPLRKLILAMPLTAALVAVAAKALTDLSWQEAFLLGALLSPTDPVLSSAVVTNPRVPRLVRHSLNLESGPDDGLALPAVLALTASPAAGGSDFVGWEFVPQDLAVGSLPGLLVGCGGALPLPRGDVFGADGSLASRRSPRSGWASPRTAARSYRRRGTASSRCSSARSYSAFAGRACASASSAARRTSSSW